MPRKKYMVNLSPDERKELGKLMSFGEAKARKLTRARILLEAVRPEASSCALSRTERRTKRDWLCA